MTKASDNAFPSLLITEGTEPSAPAAGKQRVYIDSTTHHLMRTNSSGTETDIETAAAGGLAADTLWDAAGDIVQGTGANAAAKLSAGLTGQVLKSAGAAAANAWAYPPGYEFDYVGITSNVSITATTQATANTVVTGNAVTYDGSTVVIIEFFSAFAKPASSAAADMTIVLYDGASAVGNMGYQTAESTNAAYLPLSLRVRLTPSNAAHTYSIRAFVSTGTGVVGANSGGANGYPAFIRITKV